MQYPGLINTKIKKLAWLNNCITAISNTLGDYISFKDKHSIETCKLCLMASEYTEASFVPEKSDPEDETVNEDCTCNYCPWKAITGKKCTEHSNFNNFWISVDSNKMPFVTKLVDTMYMAQCIKEFEEVLKYKRKRVQQLIDWLSIFKVERSRISLN